MAKPLISVSNLYKRYDRKSVLKGVDLAVDEGHVTALLGANGAGKTTLMRIVAGLVTGVLVLGNRELLAWTPIIPLWDPWAFAVWLAGLSGNTVTWRGRTIQLTPDGRIPR